jgi:hypothetical protein
MIWSLKCREERKFEQVLDLLLLYFVRNLLNLWKSETRKEVWARPLITRRESHCASTTVLKELTTEDPLAYKNNLRMSTDKFEKLLAIVDLKIRKRGTVMITAILTRTKLEVTWRATATTVVMFFLFLCNISNEMV